MSKKQDAFGRLDDHSLVEFAELIWKRGLLETLAKRAPAFSKFTTGVTVQLPVSPDPSAPTPEISPGLGPIGPTLKLGFKGGEFRRFAKREGVDGVFAEFFSAKYFDKLQRRCESALSLEATRILRRLQRRLTRQLSSADYEREMSDLANGIGNDGWPPRKIFRDVFNEIAIRFLGNGAPHHLYQHVIIWNTNRGDDRESSEFIQTLGRALRDRPKEMFDGKDWAIMLLWDEMPRGIPRLARWRDEGALACLKLTCRDHAFSMDAYRDRLRKLGLSPEKPKLIKGYLNGGALAIDWASPVRNLVKSHTGKN
jgi:hypothetical protein